MGIYLSAHPLDEYSAILASMCNTHPSDLDDRKALAAKNKITVGGIVTSVKERLSRTGVPFGIVKIEDFEGAGELAIFREDWGRWKGMLAEGSLIYITANCTQRRENVDAYNLTINDIQYLQTVKEKQIQKFTIVMDSSSIDAGTVNDIISFVESSPGKIDLCFRIIDREHRNSYSLRSSVAKIDISHALVTYIDSREGLDFEIN